MKLTKDQLQQIIKEELQMEMETQGDRQDVLFGFITADQTLRLLLQYDAMSDEMKSKLEGLRDQLKKMKVDIFGEL